MVKHKKLYLGSGSQSRRMLMNEAGYVFEVVGQSADEQSCELGLPLEELTKQLAELKMAHVLLPAGVPDERCWVITADTLCVDLQGTVHGKPVDFQHAVRMIELIKQGSTCATGLCVDRNVWRDGGWQLEARVVDCVSATIAFDVPCQEIELYFAKLKELEGFDYRQLACGFSMRGYGAQYVKTLSGSYTAIIGLPMYELRCALRELGYFC